MRATREYPYRGPRFVSVRLTKTGPWRIYDKKMRQYLDETFEKRLDAARRASDLTKNLVP